MPTAACCQRRSSAHQAPEEKTRLVLFLAAKHLLDYDSTHCSPLPRDLFHEPWDLFHEAGVNGTGTGTQDESSDQDKNQGKL